MSQIRKNSNRASLVPRCVICSRLKVGTTWMLDRRPPGTVPNPDSICPVCRARYFIADLAARREQRW